DSPAAWARSTAGQVDEGYVEQGFVLRGSRVIHLAPHVCYALDLLLRRDAPRVGLGCMAPELAARGRCALAPAATALALRRGAQGAHPVAGVQGGARAGSSARQTVPAAARDLGVATGWARLVGRYTASRTLQPPRYRDPVRCRDGGAWDLDPGSHR